MTLTEIVKTWSTVGIAENDLLDASFEFVELTGGAGRNHVWKQGGKDTYLEFKWQNMFDLNQFYHDVLSPPVPRNLSGLCCNFGRVRGWGRPLNM